METAAGGPQRRYAAGIKRGRAAARPRKLAKGRRYHHLRADDMSSMSAIDEQTSKCVRPGIVGRRARDPELLYQRPDANELLAVFPWLKLEVTKERRTTPPRPVAIHKGHGADLLLG